MPTTDDTNEHVTRVSATREEDARMRLALEAARMGTWERDLRTGQDFWSEQQEALFGLAPGSFATTHRSFLDLVLRDDRQPIEDAARRAIEGGGRYDSEFRVRRHDGNIRWMAGRGDVIRDAQGHATHMVGVTMDITDRKLTELRLATEHAIAGALSEATSLRSAAPGVLAAVCHNTGWLWAAMWVVDRPTSVLRCVDVWERPGGEAASLRQQSVTFDKHIGLPGRVWALARPLWIADISLDANCPRREAAVAAGMRGAVAFPVFVRQEVAGVLEFVSNPIGPSDSRLLDMMTSVCGQVGQFIDRRRSDRSRIESEARTAAVIEAALDCIVGIDHTGKLIEWNPAAERTFGYTRGEVMGREMAALIIPPALRDAHRAGLARYLRTGEGPVIGTRLEVTAVCKDGRELPVELAITRISKALPPVFTAYLRDISGRKRAEEESRLANEQAVAANAAKDQFLAMLSHELRTPLTPVLASVEMIGRIDALPPEVTAALETISRNVQMEARIIDDLLDLTRISRGKVELRTETVDAHASLRHALEVCQHQIDEKRLAVVQHLAAEHPHVSADPARLQQVFWNLIGNAVKFTPECGQIWLRSCDTSPGQLCLEIADTGIGIDAELLPRLFNAFEQGERAVTRRYGGLGLGLSISKALVEMHHGTLTAASGGSGTGATFTLRLPTVPAPQPHSSARNPVDAASGQSLRILLVEDHEDTLKVMTRLLRMAGHHIRTAASVHAALEVAGIAELDLLISDIGLPDGSGFDLMRQLKAKYPIRGIALSGFGMDEDVLRAKEAGFDLHLTKPVSLNVIEAALKKLTPAIDGSV